MLFVQSAGGFDKRSRVNSATDRESVAKIAISLQLSGQTGMQGARVQS
jgi:hypothetical protein